MAELEKFSMLVGGKAVGALSGKTFQSQNPYTGEPWAEIPDGGPEDVDAAVSAARAALDGEWGATTGFARATLMRRLADLITENADRLARLEVNDSGKLYREMFGQLNGLGGWYQYYAGIAATMEGRQIPTPNPNYLVYTRREPVGVVAAITPWNSPLLLMSWKLAPALAAGCAVVVKPSEHSPVSTLGFVELVDRAGPAGCGQRRHRVVTGDRRSAGVPSRSGQGGVHGLDRHRPRRREGRRGEHQQGHVGTGRKVPAGRVPRRGPGRSRQRDRRGRLRRDRADVHGRIPADRARRRPRSPRATDRRPRGGVYAGRPQRPGHRYGPRAQHAAVREGHRVSRHRASRGGDRGLRRR